MVKVGDKIKTSQDFHEPYIAEVIKIKKYPHPRSIESIKNLAIHRGIESGLKNAEAFRLIRSIND